MTKLEKKLSGIGHGGLNCPCCAPRPGSMARRKVVRRGRRRAKELAIKEGLADVSFREIETELIWEWCDPIYEVDYDSEYFLGLDIPPGEYDDLDDDLDYEREEFLYFENDWFVFYNKQFDLLFNEGIY